MGTTEDSLGCRHIVGALDGSDLAEQVLPHVEALAKRLGSTVILLRVVTPVETLLFAGTMFEPLSPRRHAELEQTNEELHEDAVSYLASLRDRLTASRLVVDCAGPGGRTWEMTVEQAPDHGADLIAMTTHGRGGLRRWVFGSVEEDVLRRAPCQVLLVRTGQDG